MICAHCTKEIGTEEIDSGQLRCPHCGEEPLLHGDFRLEEVVGRGAAGTTFRALRKSDGLEVAVKELLFHRLDSFKTQELFEREASTLEQLDHRAIPDYVDSFVLESGRSASLYLVQEFIDGQSLEQELQQRRYNEMEALEVLAELVEITAYLHGLQPPVIHRDIKPSNIMRRATDGRLVLIDFGSVRDVIAQPSAGDATIAGTYGFMAPEQFRGQALPASDIYGLATTIINLLARRSPAEMLGADGRPQWENHTNVSVRFRELINEMLSLDPASRPTSVEILQRIEALKLPAPVAPAAPRRVPEASRSGLNPQLVILIVPAVISFSVLLSVVGFFLLSSSYEMDEHDPQAPLRVASPSTEESGHKEDEQKDEQEDELPEFSEVAPAAIGPLRLYMTKEEAQEAVPDEGKWSRGGRGRPMPPGETRMIEIELLGKPVECSSLFTEKEGLSSITCTMRVIFEKEDHGKIRDELVAGFQEEYGAHTRYTYVDGSDTYFYWWTHPESELVFSAQIQDYERIRGPRGHSTKRFRLETTYYMEWQENAEREREEERQRRLENPY